MAVQRHATRFTVASYPISTTLVANVTKTLRDLTGILCAVEYDKHLN